MGGMSKDESFTVELKVTIHDTPAALRFGSDGYLITFAGTELDKAEAAKLLLVNKRALKLTVEIDDGKETEKESSEAGVGSGRPWLRKRAVKTDG